MLGVPPDPGAQKKGSNSQIGFGQQWSGDHASRFAGQSCGGRSHRADGGAAPPGVQRRVPALRPAGGRAAGGVVGGVLRRAAEHGGGRQAQDALAFRAGRLADVPHRRRTSTHPGGGCSCMESALPSSLVEIAFGFHVHGAKRVHFLSNFPDDFMRL